MKLLLILLLSSLCFAEIFHLKTFEYSTTNYRHSWSGYIPKNVIITIDEEREKIYIKDEKTTELLITFIDIQNYDELETVYLYKCINSKDEKIVIKYVHNSSKYHKSVVYIFFEKYANCYTVEEK